MSSEVSALSLKGIWGLIPGFDNRLITLRSVNSDLLIAKLVIALPFLYVLFGRVLEI